MALAVRLIRFEPLLCDVVAERSGGQVRVQPERPRAEGGRRGTSEPRRVGGQENDGKQLKELKLPVHGYGDAVRKSSEWFGLESLEFHALVLRTYERVLGSLHRFFFKAQSGLGTVCLSGWFLLLRLSRSFRSSSLPLAF